MRRSMKSSFDVQPPPENSADEIGLANFGQRPQ